MEPFLEIFGNITVGFLVKLACAVAFAGDGNKIRAFYIIEQED